MQPVERKKKRSLKHGRMLSVAAAFVLLGGIAAAYLLWPRAESPKAGEPISGAATEAVEEKTENDSRPEETGETPVPASPEASENGDGETAETVPEGWKHHRGTLQVRQAEELVSVTVAVRGQEPWTLIRDDAGNMHMEGSEDWDVKDRLARQVEEAVTTLVYEEILSEDPAEYRDHLDEFGLENPFITAEVRFADGGEVILRLGDEVPIEKSVRYMLVDGDDRLYAASHALAEDLDIEKEALHPVTQPEIYEVLLDRITVTGKDGTERAEWRLRGSITDPDADTNWEITAPFRYCADEMTIRNLKSSAGNLRMGVYMGEATEALLAEYGLAEPEYTLELHMAAGSTGTVSDLGVYDVVERESGSITLQVSRSGNEMIDYVRCGEGIFKVSHLTLSAFLDTVPGDTAARYIAPVPPGSLESMAVETGGETTVFTLERTGETDPDTAEEIVVCRKNGEEISREAFEAAYDRLMTVTVSGSLPEGAQWQEPHTKYTFRAVSGGTHTVELSEWDGLHDAVTMDGETRFYLIRRGAEFTLDQE